MRIPWLVAAVLSVGCLGSNGGQLVRPDELAPVSLGPPEGCGDLSGTYRVQPSLSRRSVEPASGEPLDGPRRPARPLALFFAGLDRPEAFERATVVGPSSDRRLRITFVGTDVERREILLEEGLDYRCDHGAVRFERGRRVLGREQAIIRLFRGDSGALVEETAIQGPALWFLMVPLGADSWQGEWSSYPRLEDAP
jgi:hypothetical protein